MKDPKALQEIFARDDRLIRLPSKGRAVFVGDTHGDLDATETVFKLFFEPGNILIFLGDYVDRGEESRENMEFLLQKKSDAPDRVFLLAGNHEGYCSLPFSPADFWESLSPEEFRYYSSICRFLPFAAVSSNGLLAVHGAPPDVSDAEKINTIQMCSEQWQQLTWGDFMEEQGEFIGSRGGRPVFGEDYFSRTMKQLGARVLIRSHQPQIRPVIFGKRCLTLMTSYYYTFSRHIAIADLEKTYINSVDDLDRTEI
ncbi:MAG: metallophosphoesterase family protein [Nitrospirota bacterium]